MKTKNCVGKRQAFSLVELMIVIAIILLLAGILIAALPGVQSKIARGRVEAFIGELKGGIERYHVDNGIYPPNPSSGDRDSQGEKGATVLYKYLSGDFDENGTADSIETTDENNPKYHEKIYVTKLDYESNKKSKEPRSAPFQGKYAVMDSFGNPVRYLCDSPNTKPAQRKTVNPTFDIWSIVDTDPKDAGEFSVQAKYITNWQGN